MFINYFIHRFDIIVIAGHFRISERLKQGDEPIPLLDGLHLKTGM